ncbi:Os06g0177225 [Oryza sativa Japonica Group]|uniref:Os06g0176125 protein n=1 Tax=Oryza sativa subsp. japonica TaxID=39947 RepID=A0A0P0WTH9_ORYSJ|nr:hypothetical protein EE612_032234 [Oryza sativa]BAS96414.1 Os06g0176125 [Oryza sativa Japonica Group]BAS96429.1 Os06g0177225 [Oryza sativa Japonica Group]
MRLLVTVQPKVEPPEPDRVQDHVEHVEPLRRLVQHEMALHQPHAVAEALHLRCRDPLQQLPQPRHIGDRHRHRERLPPQHVGERRRVPVGDYHRHAPGVDRLHHPRARHLVPARAQAEPAPPHVPVVRVAALAAGVGVATAGSRPFQWRRRRSRTWPCRPPAKNARNGRGGGGAGDRSSGGMSPS